MKESERLALIAEMVSNAKHIKVAPQFQGLLDDLKQEKLAEEFTLEHGTQHASDDEVKRSLFLSMQSKTTTKMTISTMTKTSLTWTA